jgi:hypothetical protein
MAKGKGLSKRERKELKKKNRLEEREKVRSEKRRIEKRDRYIKYGAVAAVLLVAGFFLMDRDPGTNGASRILINPTSHDFGDVSVRGGVVKTVMTIKNEGDSDLVINEMDTSCGCTSATVEKDGKEGPAFGMKMHGDNPVGWSERVKPGENALLNIYYDPMVHPDLRGPVTRSVAVYSNDERTSVKEVRISVNQVD